MNKLIPKLCNVLRDQLDLKWQVRNDRLTWDCGSIVHVVMPEISSRRLLCVSYGTFYLPLIDAIGASHPIEACPNDGLLSARVGMLPPSVDRKERWLPLESEQLEHFARVHCAPEIRMQLDGIQTQLQLLAVLRDVNRRLIANQLDLDVAVIHILTQLGQNHDALAYADTSRRRHQGTPRSRIFRRFFETLSSTSQ